MINWCKYSLAHHKDSVKTREHSPEETTRNRVLHDGITNIWRSRIFTAPGCRVTLTLMLAALGVAYSAIGTNPLLIPRY